jgi:hypothetical protein
MSDDDNRHGLLDNLVVRHGAAALAASIHQEAENVRALRFVAEPSLHEIDHDLPRIRERLRKTQVPRGLVMQDVEGRRDPFTLEDFSREKGLDYHPSRLPVKLETFIAYGQAFQDRFVPQVERKRLVALSVSYQFLSVKG